MICFSNNGCDVSHEVVEKEEETNVTTDVRIELYHEVEENISYWHDEFDQGNFFCTYIFW
jgi:hypothetical protein